MADYRLSERADSDLTDILVFSIERFGLERAERYKNGLERCLRRVAQDPRVGQQMTGRARIYFRYSCQRHVIFYSLEATEVFVVRVLHASMDHNRHVP